MFKSVRSNKAMFFLIMANMFSFMGVYAQVNIYGNWRVDNYLTNRDVNEYSMVRQNENNRYGILLTLNLDGTFTNRNLPECGNDTFVNISGRFLIIDDSHIRFILQKRNNSSYETDSNSELELNNDLGVFYIYKDSGSVRLIKSNGILKDDKDKMLYKHLVRTFNEQWRLYRYAWKFTDKQEAEEIVRECIEKEKLLEWSNCEIVFSSSEKGLFIVKENKNFHYVIYNSHDKKVSLAYPKK